MKQIFIELDDGQVLSIQTVMEHHYGITHKGLIGAFDLIELALSIALERSRYFPRQLTSPISLTEQEYIDQYLHFLREMFEIE